MGRALTRQAAWGSARAASPGSEGLRNSRVRASSYLVERSCQSRAHSYIPARDGACEPRTRHEMRELNKAEMGRRIRQIRLGAKLRQWELAKLLGTTQSAVHKYEHGVVPEPRRLVELARVGGTSIEWILTGEHWENGSDEQQRVTAELLTTACILREISAEGRATVNEALRVVREAVQALEQGDRHSVREVPGVDALRDHAGDTLRVLESAWRIQRAVLRRVTEEASRRLDRSSLFFKRPGYGEEPESSTRADRS